VCSCPDGEQLGNDSKTCEVIAADPCDSAGCADACKVVNSVATCACFDGKTLDADGTSCTDATAGPAPEPETSTGTYPTNMHDNADNFIHARDWFKDTHCWYKNFHGWKSGQRIVYVPCDKNPHKSKFQFEWTNSTGLIQLTGSVGQNGFTDGLCVKGAKLANSRKGHAVTAACDPSDNGQTFDYEPETGKIKSRFDPRYCAMVAEIDVTIRFNWCTIQSWGPMIEAGN